MRRGETQDLDDPERIGELRRRIRSKPALRHWYEECYSRYGDCLEQCPEEGLAVELGAGGSFVQDSIPGIVTSDLLPYEGVDRSVDAMAMPFEDQSVRALLMQNVFHHLPDVSVFLDEARRVLKPGGRILMIEPHPGWIATPFWRYLHHEDFDPTAASWEFESNGPLTDANGALAWIVFERDRAVFEERFPELEIASYRIHTALRYFLAGGLQSWSLIPGWADRGTRTCDEFLARHLPSLGSFVDVELVKRTATPPTFSETG